jgi:endonuclease YncB( thermonuclease family)
MKALNDREGVPLYAQEFVRFVENDEYEPEFQAEQREEDENHRGISTIRISKDTPLASRFSKSHLSPCL